MNITDKEQYFSISCSEDGIRIEKIDNISEFLNQCVEEDILFADDFPEDRWSKKRDVIYNENCLECMDFQEVLLIKGCIVVPKKKEVVTEYVIES